MKINKNNKLRRYEISGHDYSIKKKNYEGDILVGCLIDRTLDYNHFYNNKSFEKKLR